MIVTLTANPSLDRTAALDEPLTRGAVHRVVSVTSQAGGKGVNISRACVSAGVATDAVLPAPADDPFVVELRAAGITCTPVPTASSPRVNLTITEPDGTTTKLNTPGAQADAALLDALAAAVHDRAEDAAWVVLAGSLPPGAPTSWYAELVAALADLPVRVAVDTSDEPLAALVAGLDRAAPTLMKPNAEELASFTGGDAEELERDPEAAAKAALTLVEAGVGTVLATLGGHGAVLVDRTGAWHATPPPTSVVSTVGAGDSSLFGYLLGDLRQQPTDHRLALAVAYGSAAAGLPGTTIPLPTQVHPELVTVRGLSTTLGD